MKQHRKFESEKIKKMINLNSQNKAIGIKQNRI